jgi:predicted metal-dependent phosphoesterase TrpH
MIIDLHVHTKYSRDSNIEPHELFRVAQSRGLDGIAVTDHDTIKGWERFSGGRGCLVIRGIERTTDRGSVIGLFLNEGIEARGFWEAIDEIRGQGGVVVLPHPCDRIRRDAPKVDSLNRSLLEATVDAVEVFNARCLLSRFNKDAEKLAEDLGKHRVGGSDAHTLGEVGNARTLFDCDSLEEVHAQLTSGGSINTVVQGRLSGTLVHLSSTLNRMKREK